MALSWHLTGEKQGRNVGVTWTMNLESRSLVVYFAILSVTQAENRVKKVVADVFRLPTYIPIAEFVLPQSISAMEFVTSRIAQVDRVLESSMLLPVIMSPVF